MKFFGTSPELWLGLQKDYELDVAIDEIGDRIEQDVRTFASIKILASWMFDFHVQIELAASEASSMDQTQSFAINVLTIGSLIFIQLV